MERKGTGYFFWVLTIAAKSFQCKVSYQGKLNSTQCSFNIWGLKKDIEMFLPVAKGLQYYTEVAIKDLKVCYIGADDFRVFKREYFKGFAKGLEVSLQKALLEMKINEKYELAIISVPAVVQEKYEGSVYVMNSTFKGRSPEGYAIGYKHGLKYDVEKKNLIQ